MRIRSFIVAYALVLAVLLFANRRSEPVEPRRFSHVIDLTDARTAGSQKPVLAGTQIIAPDALIPGTWAANEIPPERLIAPLVVMDLNVAPPAQISLDDIEDWETKNGTIPQGAVVAIRQPASAKPTPAAPAARSLPITAGAAQFLMDARYTLGFAVESPADVRSDKALAHQLALHGNYVVEGATSLAAIPATGSLIMVSPAEGKKSGTAPVRVLAMVR